MMCLPCLPVFSGRRRSWSILDVLAAKLRLQRDVSPEPESVVLEESRAVSTEGPVSSSQTGGTNSPPGEINSRGPSRRPSTSAGSPGPNSREGSIGTDALSSLADSYSLEIPKTFFASFSAAGKGNREKELRRRSSILTSPRLSVYSPPSTLYSVSINEDMPTANIQTLPEELLTFILQSVLYCCMIGTKDSTGGLSLRLVCRRWNTTIQKLLDLSEPPIWQDISIDERHMDDPVAWSNFSHLLSHPSAPKIVRDAMTIHVPHSITLFQLLSAPQWERKNSPATLTGLISRAIKRTRDLTYIIDADPDELNTLELEGMAGVDEHPTTQHLRSFRWRARFRPTVPLDIRLQLPWSRVLDVRDASLASSQVPWAQLVSVDLACPITVRECITVMKLGHASFHHARFGMVTDDPDATTSSDDSEATVYEMEHLKSLDVGWIGDPNLAKELLQHSQLRFPVLKKQVLGGLIEDIVLDGPFDIHRFVHPAVQHIIFRSTFHFSWMGQLSVASTILTNLEIPYFFSLHCGLPPPVELPQLRRLVLGRHNSNLGSNPSYHLDLLRKLQLPLLEELELFCSSTIGELKQIASLFSALKAFCWTGNHDSLREDASSQRSSDEDDPSAPSSLSVLASLQDPVRLPIMDLFGIDHPWTLAINAFPFSDRIHPLSLGTLRELKISKPGLSSPRQVHELLAALGNLERLDAYLSPAPQEREGEGGESGQKDVPVKTWHDLTHLSLCSSSVPLNFAENVDWILDRTALEKLQVISVSLLPLHEEKGKGKAVDGEDFLQSIERMISRRYPVFVAVHSNPLKDGKLSIDMVPSTY